MIRFEQVSKKYTHDTFAVKSLDLEVKKGEFFVLIGPSGCGKTTTLKMINRLIKLSEGTVWINGKKISDYNIDELRWNIGYVLQQISLFPHMTIGENIAVVPELKSWGKDKISKRVDELLNMVGLAPASYRNRKPSELSGGQQQRVGVLRALAADPEILLMDEPFSALDPVSREKLQDDLIKIQREIKKTIVFVTHDMNEAMKMGDRICIMKAGEVVQIGTPLELLNNPANRFVRDFVGSQDHNFKLVDMMTPIERPNMELDGIEVISLATPIHEVFEQLINVEHVHIEQDGQVIGTVNRQTIMQYMANYMKVGGEICE